MDITVGNLSLILHNTFVLPPVGVTQFTFRLEKKQKKQIKRRKWHQPLTNSSCASSGTATLGTMCPQPPSAFAPESIEFEEECFLKYDSIPVSTTETINWMLARVLQAAGIEAKTSIVQVDSRMNCNMKSNVTFSTSPTGEQMFKRLSSSHIIRQTSEAVLAGSTPERAEP